MSAAPMLTTCKFCKVMPTGRLDQPDGENGTLRVPPSSSLPNSDFAPTFKPHFHLFFLSHFFQNSKTESDRSLSNILFHSPHVIHIHPLHSLDAKVLPFHDNNAQRTTVKA